ncbi:hypothetical protein [Rhizobium sp. RU36D]|nr:hypothetical protein [Rhizobium sp. RU36D]SMD07541.1 hypothetical protein SAMN05880593_11987 [Rhizobium sp. RU36D]
MTTKTAANATQPKAPAAKSDLDKHYRPLGLKAVIAAALMLQRKPKKQVA